MSIENPNQSEDMKAAWELFESSDVLRNDEYAREVLEKGGETKMAGKVDIGHFLAAREAILMDDGPARERLQSIDEEAVRAAMVVHSQKPEEEEK
jgi:hypothetical protein